MTTDPGGGPQLPKVHTAVVAILDHTDGESIATAAASAAMALLAKVSADQRAGVSLDRVSIAQPESVAGVGLFSLFGGSLLGDAGRYAVVVSARVIPPKTEPNPAPAGEGRS